MSQPGGTEVPMQAVLEAQRERLNALLEENIMLTALLKERERVIERMKSHTEG